jgi:hypothetical protein
VTTLPADADRMHGSAKDARKQRTLTRARAPASSHA